MRLHLTVLLAVIAWGGCAPSSFGQAKDPAALLKSMIDATSLDSADAGSWHWKMDVTVYDFNGKNPVPGGIEVWRSDGNMRTVMTAAGAQQTTLRVGNKLYRSGEDSPNFFALEAAFMQVLNPIPNGLLDPSVKLKLVGRKVGQATVDCVQPTIKMPDIPTYNTDERLEFCAMAGTDHFAAAYEANKTLITIGQSGLFRSRQVPLSFQISSLEHLRVDGRTTALSSFSPAQDEFAIAPELHPLQLPIKVTSRGILFLTLVHDMAPYPPGAKSRDAEGRVEFDVVIGEDGRVASHTLVAAAHDPELNQAVEKSLTHLILRPYLINGVAVQVETAVTMNYGIAH